MVLAKQTQDVVVYSFHCGGDEQTPLARTRAGSPGVIDDVLDLDGSRRT